MGRIFFCEGKNDVALTRTFFERLDREFQLKRFIGEEIDHSRLQNHEARAMKSFIEPYNPYDVLAKSENGKPSLLLMFVTVINFLSGRDLDVHLVIDLDDGNVSDLTSNINEMIRGRYEGQRIEIDDPTIINRNTDVVAYRHELLQGGNPVDEFTVIAFEPELETVAGIADGDDDAARDRKLRALLNRDGVYSVFHDAIL